MPIDYSKYPPNWKTEIVPRILHRADNCCEFCGVENGKELTSVPLRIKSDGRYKIKRLWITDPSDVYRLKLHNTRAGESKIVKVVLTVAHLDHDEENHDVKDDRLKALCQPCHLNYDASEKQRRINAKASSTQQREPHNGKA